MSISMRASMAAVLALVACAPGGRTFDGTQLDAILRDAVEARRVPGVVAMVATREGVVYEGAAGLPKDAIVAIASMTKPITSVAVMQLVEGGRVRLDEPASTYLPALGDVQVLDNGELRLATSRPTVRQLLTHTSGFGYEFLNPELAARVASGTLVSAFTGTDEFLRAPLVADPGVRWEYGISTDWLGRLVEAVSGERLDAYFRARIFEPLGMTETFFDVPPDLAGRMAPRHGRQPDGGLAATPPEPVQPAAYLSGGGGLHSTAADYLRFARAVLGGGALDGRRILAADTVATIARDQIGGMTLRPVTSQNPQLVAPGAVLPGGLDGFGLGFALNRSALASGRSAGSLSWMGLFNTFFWVDPERGVCAVLLTQMLPFGDPGPVGLVEEFDRAVYRALR